MQCVAICIISDFFARYFDCSSLVVIEYNNE